MSGSPDVDALSPHEPAMFTQSNNVTEADLIGPEVGSTSKYVAIRQIGAGANGRAFLVKHRTNGELYVAKLVDLSGVDEKKRRYAISEQQCHALLTHFAISRQIDYQMTTSNVMLTVAELGEAGDLAAIVKQRAKAKALFQEHEAAFLILQLVLAVDAMHRQRMMHRDIKAANVFVKSNGLLKLGDFGFSRQFDETVSDDVANSFCGTPSYVAPELWRRERYSKKADVWSLGVLCYELVALRRPFIAETFAQLAELVCQGNPARIPPNFSDGLADCIAKMLDPVATRRWSTLQVLAHPYMNAVMESFGTAVLTQPGIPPITRDEIGQALDVVRHDVAAIGSDDSGNSQSTGIMTDDSRHASPNRSPTTGAPLESHLYKLCSEGWKQRLVRLVAGEITVEVLGSPHNRKQLHMRHMVDIRPIVIREDRTSPFGGLKPILDNLVSFGIEIELTNRKSVLFIAQDHNEQRVWIARLLEDLRRHAHRGESSSR